MRFSLLHAIRRVWHLKGASQGGDQLSCWGAELEGGFSFRQGAGVPRRFNQQQGSGLVAWGDGKLVDSGSGNCSLLRGWGNHGDCSSLSHRSLFRHD